MSKVARSETESMRLDKEAEAVLEEGCWLNNSISGCGGAPSKSGIIVPSGVLSRLMGVETLSLVIDPTRSKLDLSSASGLFWEKWDLSLAGF